MENNNNKKLYKIENLNLDGGKDYQKADVMFQKETQEKKDNELMNSLNPQFPQLMLAKKKQTKKVYQFYLKPETVKLIEAFARGNGLKKTDALEALVNLGLWASKLK